MQDDAVFISYAGEDRAIAERVATELIGLGIPTFYDRFKLQVGDSITEVISNGLDAARHGVVIVSPHSLTKSLPRGELRQLRYAEFDGRTRILPIWHNVTPEVVREHAPGLQDLWGVNTSVGLRGIVRALAERIVETTVAVVPVWERPVERFLDGVGRLTLGLEESAEFTVWEALLTFDENVFPLFVDGETLQRDDLLARAASVLALQEVRAQVEPDVVERIRAMHHDRFGRDPADFMED